MKAQSSEDILARLGLECHAIEQSGELQNVWRNFQQRLYLCLLLGGLHVERHVKKAQIKQMLEPEVTKELLRIQAARRPLNNHQREQLNAVERLRKLQES